MTPTLRTQTLHPLPERGSKTICTRKVRGTSDICPFCYYCSCPGYFAGAEVKTSTGPCRRADKMMGREKMGRERKGRLAERIYHYKKALSLFQVTQGKSLWWDSGLKPRSTLEAWLQLQYCFNFKFLDTRRSAIDQRK